MFDETAYTNPLHVVQGKLDEAEPFLKRALAIFEEVLDPEHVDVATALGNLASLAKKKVYIASLRNMS